MRGERGSVSLFRHFSLSKPNCLHFVSELGEGDSPTLADIPVILPLSTPPNGILCLYGSSEKANLPLSPWIYWNRKMAGSSVLKQGSFYRRIRSITGNGKEEATLERSIKGHCDYKIMGPLITIKATYHVPFQTNTICGIGSNECSRYHIAVEDSNITGHSISPCVTGFSFIFCISVSRVVQWGIGTQVV
ncbi:hypothetical protein YC2023_078250 [Brassica napus]